MHDFMFIVSILSGMGILKSSRDNLLAGSHWFGFLVMNFYLSLRAESPEENTRLVFFSTTAAYDLELKRDWRFRPLQ